MKRFLLGAIVTFTAFTVLPSNVQAAPQCPDYVPQVDPWKLQDPVLLGSAKAVYYYNGVVLAGDSKKVQAFLDCYNLTTRWNPNYSSAYRIWADCNEIVEDGKSQSVCVAIDDRGRAADGRIFSKDYAGKVAKAVFGQ